MICSSRGNVKVILRGKYCKNFVKKIFKNIFGEKKYFNKVEHLKIIIKLK